MFPLHHLLYLSLEDLQEDLVGWGIKAEAVLETADVGGILPLVLVG